MPLRKFIETLPSGAPTGRVAYVVDAASLPPNEGATWREQRTFNEAAADRANPALGQIFNQARRDGVAVLEKRLVA